MSRYLDPVPDPEPWVAPIRAIRVFRVSASNRLLPMIGDPCWAPDGEWSDTGRCWRSQDHHRENRGTRRQSGAWIGYHCVCGFHAWKGGPGGIERLDWEYARPATSPRMVAEVELAGMIIEHEWGWRASRARVVERIGFVDSIIRSRVQMMDKLTERYRRDGDGQNWEALEAYRDRTRRGENNLPRIGATGAGPSPFTNAGTRQDMIEAYAKSITLRKGPPYPSGDF